MKGKKRKAKSKPLDRGLHHAAMTALLMALFTSQVSPLRFTLHIGREWLYCILSENAELRVLVILSQSFPYLC